MVIASCLFGVHHQGQPFLYPPISQVNTDVSSQLNLLFFSLNKFSLCIRCSGSLNILMAFHCLVPVCQCLTHTDNLKFYTILQIWSLSTKEGKIITPLDLLAALLRLAFTGARVHCWSVHNFCPPGLLCLLCKATFLSVNPKLVLLCSYSASGTTMYLFLLSSVRFLLARFSRLSPEWYFNVTHELAEDAVYPTVQAANDDFK